jgi:hypothetical protein
MKANVPECIIDEVGTFKYIQIQIINKSDKNDTKIVIRGTQQFSYHKEIFRHFLNGILEGPKELYENYDFEPIGGGRIQRTHSDITVYGYSTSYGQCDHKLTCDIIKKYVPDFIKIEYSFGGY